jgi:hypothetical protein
LCFACIAVSDDGQVADLFGWISFHGFEESFLSDIRSKDEGRSRAPASA